MRGAVPRPSIRWRTRYLQMPAEQLPPGQAVPSGFDMSVGQPPLVPEQISS